MFVPYVGFSVVTYIEVCANENCLDIRIVFPRRLLPVAPIFFIVYFRQRGPIGYCSFDLTRPITRGRLYAGETLLQ